MKWFIAILALVLGLSFAADANADCGRRLFRRNRVVRHNVCHDNFVQEIQIIVVEPQIEYYVQPEVSYEKIERVVEVKEVERIRIEKRVKLVAAVRQLVYPVIVEKVRVEVDHY